jgi:predicted transcriptional regulator
MVNAPKLQHAVSLPPTAFLRSAAAAVYGVQSLPQHFDVAAPSVAAR